jgi:hypothetical protein
VYETAVRCSGMWLALHPVSGTASGSPAGPSVRWEPMTRARVAVAQAHQRVTEQTARDRTQQMARGHAEDQTAELLCGEDTADRGIPRGQLGGVA